MIRIKRSRVKVPATLRSPKVREALKRLESFMSEPDSRSQRQPPFDQRIYRAPDVKEGLNELFHGKCAYCESRVGVTSPMEVDLFRPRWQALSRDGSMRFEGYWWLAYEWTNLYSVCINCNRAKGSRFPIAGTPAAPGARGEALRLEEPLLLDPCADDPDAHLTFVEDGTIGSRSERGTVTIQVLGLNRSSLVESRRQVLQSMRTALQSILLSRAAGETALRELVSHESEYAGARRQLFSSWYQQEEPMAVRTGPRASQQANLARYARELSESLPSISDDVRRSATERIRVDQRALDSFSIADSNAKSQHFARTRMIERIEIRNFKPIEDLTLGFPDPELQAMSASEAPRTSDASWLMLLGENGGGKSSVLQAVALALIGRNWRHDLAARNELDARRILRHGASDGAVRVFLAGSVEPVEMTFSSASPQFEGGPDEAIVTVLGYGSTRLLPRAGIAPQMSFDFARVDNLFNPFEPLNDAGAWFAELDNGTFQHIARALKVVLQLGEEAILERENGKVYAHLFGAKVPLDELSDGYQSVIAMTTDIMRVMLRNGWETMELAEGIVLLDEIGSHLHPRWRMRIVSSLRRTFPRIQFLASTHDPLCLRGLLDGEVAVMRRDATDRLAALTDLPSVRSLRVDQLLTSELFGMNSTVDPELEDSFTEYYRLLALTKPTAAQQVRIARLKAVLDQHRVLGTNRRERMMLETIDKFLAEERGTIDESKRRQLKESTKRKLREIWNKVSPAPVSTKSRA